MLVHYLHSKGHNDFEGYCQQINQQVLDLVELTKKPGINVMEIGFNAGHSAEVFLGANENLMLTSFDLGAHDYVFTGKEYIDITYPNRHRLIIGDSKITVPEFTAKNPETKFDVIFIDGDHEYDGAVADLTNCLKLAHKNTIIILDDTYFKNDCIANWAVGPTKAWLDFVSDKKIQELGRREYCFGRGMAFGTYIM
jgi:predicted O-methyltransferase YrrM